MFADFQTVRLLLPEGVLVLAATWIYVVGAARRGRTVWVVVALGAHLAALAMLLGGEGGLGAPLRGDPAGPLAVDFLGLAVRCLALSIGLLLTLTAWRHGGRELSSEYLGTLLLVTAGMMLVAQANDLVLMFLGLELVTIPTYVLLFLGRPNRASAEATVKYFFLSVFSTALLAYGLSFLYGLAGSTTIDGWGVGEGVREALERLGAEGSPQLRWLAPVAVVLVIAGLGYKIAAVPFHFYAPDVYEGATNANAGLLAVAPKIAGVVALVRLIVVAAAGAAWVGWVLALVLAMATMTLGNACALWQRNIRRLMAYSSIAHAGYLLIGLTVALSAAETGVTGAGGVAAMVLYLLVYVLAALGTFSALAYLGSERREVSGLDELAGLSRARPWSAAAISVCMFSLAGVPPLAGFWGKFALFRGAVRMATASGPSDTAFWLGVLAVVGAINAAIAAAYYLRVVSVMYFHDASSPLPGQGGWGPAVATAACALLVVVLGALPSTAMESAARAEDSLRLPGNHVSKKIAALETKRSEAANRRGEVASTLAASRSRTRHQSEPVCRSADREKPGGRGPLLAASRSPTPCPMVYHTGVTSVCRTAAN